MRFLEIGTVFVVALAMALVVAHALEWPGKRRLDRETYLAVQTIYYPGFTFGGLSEAAGIVLLLVLVWLSPHHGAKFIALMVALASLVALHVVFWTVTQPVNKFWLVDTHVSEIGAAFFQTAAARQQPSPTTDRHLWLALRRRWEYSHIARAVLGCLSLIALLCAVVP